MNIHLITMRPFAGFTQGDTATDPASIAKVLSGEWAHSVVLILATMSKGD